MKAVFFKCSIPLETSTIDASGNISIQTVIRNMEQGEVVDVNGYSEGEGLMEFSDGSIWWVPDKKLFNIVGVGGPAPSCCGATASKGK